MLRPGRVTMWCFLTWALIQGWLDDWARRRRRIMIILFGGRGAIVASWKCRGFLCWNHFSRLSNFWTKDSWVVFVRGRCNLQSFFLFRYVIPVHSSQICNNGSIVSLQCARDLYERALRRVQFCCCSNPNPKKKKKLPWQGQELVDTSDPVPENTTRSSPNDSRKKRHCPKKKSELYRFSKPEKERGQTSISSSARSLLQSDENGEPISGELRVPFSSFIFAFFPSLKTWGSWSPSKIESKFRNFLLLAPYKTRWTFVDVWYFER